MLLQNLTKQVTCICIHTSVMYTCELMAIPQRLFLSTFLLPHPAKCDIQDIEQRFFLVLLPLFFTLVWRWHNWWQWKQSFSSESSPPIVREYIIWWNSWKTGIKFPCSVYKPHHEPNSLGLEIFLPPCLSLMKFVEWRSWEWDCDTDWRTINKYEYIFTHVDIQT